MFDSSGFAVLPQTIAPEGVTKRHETIVTLAYAAVMYLPMYIMPEARILPWTAWPGVVLSLALIVGVGYDYFRRPASIRVLYVICGIVLYLVVTMPVLDWLNTITSRVGAGVPASAYRARVIMRGAATLPIMMFAMRCSRHMARWAGMPDPPGERP